MTNTQTADKTEDVAKSRIFTSPNRLKLGVFGANLSGAATGITRLESAPMMRNWAEAREIAVAADRAGLEALVPIARWKGFGGPSQFWDRSFETFTWGAALAEATERIQIFTTCLVPLVHPVVAAKMGATLDHVSGGRWGLNVVPGWMGAEFKMFGIDLADRAQRYIYAQEWMNVLNRLWTETDEFDFKGDFFQLSGAVSEPKPVQMPRPVVMNAGQSKDGLAFAARNADMTFINLADVAGVERNIRGVRFAAGAKGRKISVWGSAHIVCRATEVEARQFVAHYVDDLGDREAAQNFATAVLGADNAACETYRVDPEILRRLMESGGNYPIVGTPEQVVAELNRLCNLGIDGIVLSWVDYPAGIAQYERELLPLMREVGLRA